MFDLITTDLKSAFEPRLVDELLAAYRDAKWNFHLGGLRLSAVEGGRFCEAAFRMIEQATTSSFTPLGNHIDSERVIATALKSNASDSIRIHIPRALRVVYDIRNKRDAAHLADHIDPNQQDATLVASILDWVLAELVRIYHRVSADEAQQIINDLVERRAPAVQSFEGFLKVLRRDLLVSDRVLLLLYERGSYGATFGQLADWLHPKMRKNLKRTLEQLDQDKLFIHSAGGVLKITLTGMHEVERKQIHRTAA